MESLMKMEWDFNLEVSSKKTGFFNDRPKAGLSANNIATMRSIIIIPQDEEKDVLECEGSSPFPI